MCKNTASHVGQHYDTVDTSVNLGNFLMEYLSMSQQKQAIASTAHSVSLHGKNVLVLMMNFAGAVKQMILVQNYKEIKNHN